MEIRVNEEDYLKLLQELKRRREQVTELQTRGTELELENRDLRVLVRRLEKFPDATPREMSRFEGLDDRGQAEAASDDLRRVQLWMRLRGM